jgi:hypothetical protein
MQIDIATDTIQLCQCGSKPDHYTVGYGSNPYYISCPGCKKSLHNGTGSIDNFIILWNDKYRHIFAPGKLFYHKY